MDTDYPAFGGLLASEVALDADATEHRDRPLYCTLKTAKIGAPVGRPLYRWTSRSGTGIVETWKTPGGHQLALGPDTIISVSESRLLIAEPHAEKLSALQTHHVLDQAIPRLLGQEGHLVVHGAAFHTSQGALLVIGEGGVGKSTLAAAASIAGHPLVADDCVMLEDTDDAIACVGNHAYLRCHPQTLDLLPALEGIVADLVQVEDKARLRLTPAARVAQGMHCPLAALVMLENAGSEPALSRPSPAEVLARLSRQLFVLDPTDKTLMACLLKQLAAVVGRVPAWRLSFSHDRNTPEQVLGAVMNALSVS